MIGPTADRPVLYFDGVCNLCVGSVQFVIKRDKKKQFLFSSLQSESGRAVTEKIKAETGSVPDSLILFYKGKYYTRSAAALYTARILGGLWSLATIFFIVPSFIRNEVYNFVAKNRYRWFGKQDECMIPTPELHSRFLN